MPILRSFPLSVALSVIVVGLSVPLVLGLLKNLHPAFDAFTHFRVHLAVILALSAIPLLFGPMRVMGLFAIALGIAASATVVGPSILSRITGTPAEASSPVEARYRLLQLNLRYDNGTPKAVLSLIGRSDADVVTLEEVSSMWLPELALTEKAYPYRIICPPPTSVGSVAILSRRPFLHSSMAECFDRGSLAIATVNFGGTAVDIAALHMGWPWPFEQPWQVPRTLPFLQKLGATAILAGDFNAVPWSATAEKIAAAGGLAVTHDIGPTWLAFPMPDFLRRTVGLPIDNILVKGGIVNLSTKRLENVGSDHLPVLVEFGLRQRQQAEVLHARLPETFRGHLLRYLR